MAESEITCAEPDFVGEQKFAAGIGDDLGESVAEGALVSDSELADLVHVVAEEIDADGMFHRGWEHVDDAAAHGELAAAFDHVDAAVGGADEIVEEFTQFVGLSRCDLDRAHVGEALDLRLQQRTHRGHDDSRRVVPLEATQHLESTTDGICAWRESFVRKRFPCRVVGDGLVAEPGAQLLSELLRLAIRRCHGQHGPTLICDRCGQPRKE